MAQRRPKGRQPDGTRLAAAIRANLAALGFGKDRWRLAPFHYRTAASDASGRAVFCILEHLTTAEDGRMP